MIKRIITNNLLLAENVRRRLQNEGVQLSICLISNLSEVNYFDSINLLILNDNSYLDKIEEQISNVVLFLADADQLKEINLKNLDLLSIYVAPFDYQLIANDLRLFIYNIERHHNSELVYDDLSLSLDTRKLTYKRKSISLKNREYQLMKFLIQNRDRIMDRNKILEEVWDINSQIQTNTVDVHISKLRAILKWLEVDREYIITVPCSGYIFQ